MDTVDGEAYRPYVFTVGQEIKGEKIYFFDDMEYCKKFISRIQSDKEWVPTVKALAAYTEAQHKAYSDRSVIMQVALLTDKEEIRKAFDNAELRYFMDAGFSFETYQKIQNWLKIGQKLFLRQ